MISVCSLIRLICVVAMPSPSKKCASAPTARVHRGQTGVSNTTSTLSFFIMPAIFRASGSIGMGSFPPMNE